MPPGSIKVMLKLDIQKLIYQTKYSNLQIASSLIVVMSHVAKVALQSVQILNLSSNPRQQRSFTIDSSYSSFAVINLGNRKQLRFVFNIFVLNILKVLFENVQKHCLTLSFIMLKNV